MSYMNCISSMIYANDFRIKILNDYPESEVVLVTDIQSSIPLSCLYQPENESNDLLKPSSLKYQWYVTSGTVTITKNCCNWTDFNSGIQSITLKVFQNENNPNHPDKNLLYQETKQFLVPHHINTLAIHEYNNFEIGEYPDPRNESILKDIDEESRNRIVNNIQVFEPPVLFYEVNPDTYFRKIFKNYTLGEFDLDPRFTLLRYPRYISLHKDLFQLIDELETFLHSKKIQFDKLSIIYGYRTPKINNSLDTSINYGTLKEPFSLHMYGKAIDFIIDQDENLVMDDINQDARITFDDGIELANYIAEFETKLIKKKSPLVGGVGLYYHHDYWDRGKYTQSPYIHIDIRGYTRDDGSFIRWIGKDLLNTMKSNNPYPTPVLLPDFPIHMNSSLEQSKN